MQKAAQAPQLHVMRLGNIPSEIDVDTRLHQAAEVGDLAAAKSLLSQACAINAIDICGRTPLHFAAANNQLEMVEYLISVGADANGQADGDGWQDHAPLGYAVGTCSTDMIQRLLQLGADPTCSGWMGLTALDLAKDRIDEEGRMIFELLQKKCLDE
ncbi:ankyrin repeat domain-containing protein [Undibacterium sp. 14-3-2]|uniref:ankyrin repeat domain-containing protein n=1 Tax=Undibacterium sp. 14-3-2 TaxID=2800129 RepID=UPI001906C46C|nr:ankyrin repeat domain-containing protein [Undibacterium sp. 14-3-2]